MLYLLKPIKDWEPWFDKAFSFVVRAPDEQQARQLASTEAGYEGNDVWLDTTKTSCEVINHDGDTEILCRDFAST